MRIALVGVPWGRWGWRTAVAMEELARGYARRGHEAVVVRPGPKDAEQSLQAGRERHVQLASPALPGPHRTRVLRDLDAVCVLLDEIGPDRLEVFDRGTSRGLGWWARAAGVPSTLWVQDRVEDLLGGGRGLPLPRRRLADLHNRATARRFDRIVCPAPYVAEELGRVGVRDTVSVPWGVELEQFHPARCSPTRAAELRGAQDRLLVAVGGLGRHGSTADALAALDRLHQRGFRARLVVMGAGRDTARIRRATRDLPVTVSERMPGRHVRSEVLAAADVVVATGTAECTRPTALEALASGAQVVGSARAGLGALVAGGAGVLAGGDGGTAGDLVADAVGVALVRGPDGRAAARRAAERYPWSRTVDTMLRLHRLPPPAPRPLSVASSGRDG